MCIADLAYPNEIQNECLKDDSLACFYAYISPIMQIRKIYSLF